MSAGDDERYDGLLLGIAQRCTGGVDELLDTFLGFLRRKTDAFTPPDGWPQLERTFVASLRRQYDIAQRVKSKKEAAAAKAKTDAAAKATAVKQPAKAPAPIAPSAAPVPEVIASLAAPAPASDADVIEMSADGSFDLSDTKKAAAATAAGAAAASPSADAAESIPEVAGAGGSSSAMDVDSAAAGAGAAAEGEKPAKPRPAGNGGTTDRYFWTQTLSDVTVTFQVPAAARARDLTVEITNRSLKVAVKGSTAPLFQAALYKRVKLDDSTWTLDDAPSAGGSATKALSVYVVKENGMEWWSAVGQGEPAIDVATIEPENSKLSDLDGDTRQTVEKMMFDQRQKAQGLPSSDELKKQEVLQRFMAAHPEMDFSKAKIS